MNRSASKLGVFVVFVLLLSAVGSWAQSSGAITGTLVDPRGALIAGASVQAFDEAKGVIVRTTTSGADGLFQLQPLQPGKYSVRVKAKGMKEIEDETWCWIPAKCSDWESSWVQTLETSRLNWRESLCLCAMKPQVTVTAECD